MKLLGKANWYLPRWLEWLPKLDVEGHEAADTGGDPGDASELVEAGEPRSGRTGDFS